MKLDWLILGHALISYAAFWGGRLLGRREGRTGKWWGLEDESDE